jgi:opacity protein-like surface antigen
MKKFAQSVVAGAAILLAGSLPVAAADLIAPPPPAPPVAMGGWYLRGDIGMTNQMVGSLDNYYYHQANTQNLVHVDKGFDAGALYDLGIGYQFNNWFRADAIVQYRGDASFHGLDTFTDGGTGNPVFDNYTAKKSEWLMMANAYVDLGDYNGIVPYLGAGIGASRNTISSFRDQGTDPTNPGGTTLAYGATASKWNLAWALHAGIGFKVTDQLTLDLGYSYIDLGNAQSGDLIAYDGTNAVYNPMYFKHITSHDLKLGMRYTF